MWLKTINWAKLGKNAVFSILNVTKIHISKTVQAFWSIFSEK